ncbi:SGNH/GDSL hydrolase family protein [Stieleria sp. TO1_6]|uniref:SGNH/GDSL hydrolase family protein n=1 Tax=Stieleria tagensis TaxID=2956795 RepID=UPI00209AB7AF|nr:SGNH/GDSL hydrolase family protein [Stieleria tagensis]MCO8120708.1 SGNH/GDSL hydrolase family protein [Stieleria tagensis]
MRKSRFAAVLSLAITLLTAPCDSADQTIPAAVKIRGNLDHSRQVFTSTGQGNVVFLGGSITEMDGYRPMVMQSLQKRFPDTQFHFSNAGIASTCSHTGAFRMPRDVISQHPDLLFVEFAVNDDQDAGHSRADAVRGMEGIIRAAKKANPELDIVMTHFVNPSLLATTGKGETPTSIGAHEKAAQHYQISTCNVAIELNQQINAGKTSWKIYGGVHPKPAGNRIAADLIEQVFNANQFSQAQQSSPSPQSQASPVIDLPAPIDASSFFRGRFLDNQAVQLGSGWSRVEPDWSNIPGSKRPRYTGRPLTVSETPGSELEVQFSGTAFGLFVVAGPDAGAVEFSMDGGDWQTVDLYHRYSKGLHYPRTVVLESGMEDTPHDVKLRVAPKSNPQSSGSAIRILEFVAS